MPPERGRGRGIGRPRTGAPYYEAQGRRGNSRLEDQARVVQSRYRAQMPFDQQEYLTQSERAAAIRRATLSDAAVREEWENWIPDPRQSRRRTTQYLQTVNLYWQIQFILGRALMRSQEGTRSMQDTLTEMQGTLTQMVDLLHYYERGFFLMDLRLRRIEERLGIGPERAAPPPGDGASPLRLRL